MANDLVSVLIPAYNVEKYIGRCLRSVLKQTYQNLEIVVVDDGSTDQTYAVATKYAHADHRIVLLQKNNEENIAKTRNYLLDHCHGKYCVWIDSDDCVKPNYVARLYQTLLQQAADLSVCRFAIRAFPFPVWSPWHTVVQTLTGNEIVPQIIYRKGYTLWNKMYRMDLINQARPIRFSLECCYGEDLLFNLFYLQRCQKVACSNARLYCYSWRSGSEVHKRFVGQHIELVNQLLQLAEQATDPVVQSALYGWVAITCCGATYLARKHHYHDSVEHLKQLAHQYQHEFYKNRLAKLWLKVILRLGLKTWCRPHNPVNIKDKGN